MSIPEVPGVMRMHASRGVQIGVILRELKRRGEPVRARPSACYEDVTNAGGAGTFNYRLPVGIELRIVQVGVGIDEDREIGRPGNRVIGRSGDRVIGWLGNRAIG